MDHKNEVIVCNTEREARIAEIVMEQPLQCWGNIPTKIVVCPELFVHDINLQLKPENKTEPRWRKKEHTDDVTINEIRYMTFDCFMSYWLDDRA